MLNRRPKRHGWVEAHLQLDADDVLRRGLARLACEVDGRYIVHILQPDVLPLAQVDALADAVVSAFRGQCLEGLLIDQIHPGGTAPSDAHSPIPSYWIDYWLERQAGLDEDAFLWRLLWHLLEVMDQMFLEHLNRPAGDGDDEDDTGDRP